MRQGPPRRRRRRTRDVRGAYVLIRGTWWRRQPFAQREGSTRTLGTELAPLNDSEEAQDDVGEW